MTDFKFHVGQHFDCDYLVEGADTVEEAWEMLMRGEADCIQQYPAEITTTLYRSGVAQRDYNDDWEDIEVDRYTLPFATTHFHVAVVLPYDDREAVTVAREAEAVEIGREWVGPNRTQVTIEAGSYHDFAVRHFTYEAGKVSDSGWRVWLNREFVGGIDP